MHKLSKIGLLVVALLVIAGFTAFVAPAQALNTVTITFDGGTGNPPSYTESGMTVTALDGSLDGFSQPSVIALLMDARAGDTYRFDFGGAPFSVSSVHFDRFSSRASRPGRPPSLFTSSNGAVEALTTPGIHQFPAAGWTGITFFTWEYAGTLDDLRSAFAVDDLVVELPGPPSSCPSGFSLEPFTPPGTGPDRNGNGLVCEKPVGMRVLVIDDTIGAPP